MATDNVMYANSIDRQGIQGRRQAFSSSTGMISSKKFKGLSAFSVCIGKETNSVIGSSNTDKENNGTIDITGETPADISVETADVLPASSSIDHAFPDDHLIEYNHRRVFDLTSF